MKTRWMLNYNPQYDKAGDRKSINEWRKRRERKDDIFLNELILVYISDSTRANEKNSSW